MDLFVYPQVLLGWAGWEVREVNPHLPNPKNFQGKPKIWAFQAVNTGIKLIHSLPGNPQKNSLGLAKNSLKNAPNPWNILLGALPHLPMRNIPFGSTHSGCDAWIWAGSIPKKPWKSRMGLMRASLPKFGIRRCFPWIYFFVGNE